MTKRFAILFVSAAVLLIGPAATAQADTATQLPFPNGNTVSILVDPGGSHVFVSGGPGSSSLVVLDYSGHIVKTISGEGGASGMALDAATHTLYVALHDQTAISEIDTQTLTETHRFSTGTYTGPSSLVIAGGKLWFSCSEGSSGCLATMNLDGGGLTAASGISGFSTLPALLAAGGSDNHLLALADRSVAPPGIAVYSVSGASPTLVKQIQADGFVGKAESMTFTPSGANLLLATGTPYYVESLATSTLEPSGQYPTGPYPIAVAVTGDGKFVAGGVEPSSGGDVLVYPAASTTPVRTWSIGTSSTNLPLTAASLAFSPDSSRLFAVTQDTATGHLVFDVLDHPTIPLKRSTTSMTASSKSVRFGGRTTLSARVKGPKSGKVDLYATTSSNNVATLVATGAVKKGVATFRVKPSQLTTYSAQLEQGSTYASSTSRSVRVAVSPIVMVSVHQIRKVVVMSGHRVIRTNFRATTRPLRPSIVCTCGTKTIETVRFVVQRQLGTSWHTVLATRRAEIGGNGIAGGWMATSNPGRYRVHAVYTGDAEFLPSDSAWKQFEVRSFPGSAG